MGLAGSAEYAVPEAVRTYVRRGEEKGWTEPGGTVRESVCLSVCVACLALSSFR